MRQYRWFAYFVFAFSVVTTVWLYASYDKQTLLPRIDKGFTASIEQPSNTPTSVDEPSSNKQSLNPVQKKQGDLTSEAYALKNDEFALENFESWLSTLGDNPTEQEVAEGVKLAKARKPYMQNLIRIDPKEALNNSVTLKEYASLPEAVVQFVEKPFSERVDVAILPNESRRSFGPLESTFLVSEADGESSLFRYGQRARILSKNSLPTQGITLNGESVISDQVLQRITQSEVDFYISSFPVGNTDADYDAYTGEAINGEPVLAIAGGYLFSFSSIQNLNTLNQKLAEAEQVIGPDAGSQLLFSKSGAASVNNISEISVGESTLQNTLAVFLASPSTWTTTKKKVFFIRVDFPDKTDPVIDQTVLESRINDDVSELIKDMSRDKTWLEADVSELVVRMPNQSSQYLALSSTWANANFLYDDAVTEFNSLSTGVDLADYDIIGIYFNDIGFDFGGYASIGGGKQWLQDAYSRSLVTHEFGHNYGLRHANFWNTTDGSSVGSGFDEEYGDVFDIMGSDYDGVGHFHTQALETLDWFESDNWENIAVSSNRRIYRFDHEDSSGLQSLRIPRDNDDYYWLGYRKNFSDTENGIYTIWQRSSGTQSWLVDATPGSDSNDWSDRYDGTISIGSTYSDTLTTPNIHITPLAKGGDSPSEWIDVQVNIGSYASNQAPSATISGPNSVHARQFVAFSAVASDPDNDDLAYAWDFGDGEVHDSQPVIHKYWASGGNYTVKLTVSDMKGGVSETSSFDVTVNDTLTDFVSRTSGVSDSLIDIDTDGSLALAITNFSVIGSTDGVSWQVFDERRDGSSGLGFNTYLRSILHNGSNWVAVGMDYSFDSSRWEGAVYTSADGINWVERFWDGSPLMDVAASDNTLVAVGDDGFAIRSVDGGLNWDPVAMGVTSGLTSIAYGQSRFIAVSPWGAGTVLTSDNGAAWVDDTANAGSGSRGYWFVDYINDKFFGTSYWSELGYLDNPSSIEFKSAHSGDTPAVTYGQGVYVAMGSSYWVSLDGTSWFQSPITPIEKRNAGIYFKDTFISVGEAGTIYQSGIVQEIDTDGDGVADSSDTDIDGDGMSNIWEESYALNPQNPADQFYDLDEDGLSNLEEFNNNTDPNTADTDGDGVNDGDEVAAGTAPSKRQVNFTPILQYLLMD